MSLETEYLEVNCVEANAEFLERKYELCLIGLPVQKKGLAAVDGKDELMRGEVTSNSEDHGIIGKPLAKASAVPRSRYQANRLYRERRNRRDPAIGQCGAIRFCELLGKPEELGFSAGYIKGDAFGPREYEGIPADDDIATRWSDGSPLYCLRRAVVLESEKPGTGCKKKMVGYKCVSSGVSIFDPNKRRIWTRP